MPSRFASGPIKCEARELPQSIDLSAYRIVQEGLTNTLKHAGRGASARVTIRYGADELCIEIVDDGGEVVTCYTVRADDDGVAERVGADDHGAADEVVHDDLAGRRDGQANHG